MSGPDVALELPRMRHMSVGMTAYAEELAARLPLVAPDLRFVTLVRTSALDLAEQIRLPLALRRLEPRLTHFLSVYAPLAAPAPFTITIHDLIHLRYPQYFKRSVGLYYATVVRAVCARAARILTDDERTVPDLERFLGVPPRKVSVVPLGADDRFSQPAPPAGDRLPYFLYVGNHRPHKDLATLFRAWQRLDPNLEIDLLLTGADDVPEEKPRRPRGSLRFLGDVDNDRLAQLYRSATALVHPALCEGFGLPMLEAAAVGCAIIACEDAVPSVLRPYVDTFPARNVEALAAAMARALAAPATGRRDEARRFAGSLTWNRCAERTADVYREVFEECRIR
ncbi:MAG: glycosyltransferase family 4 protein [Candidatus Eremiobacteraeota bacterium]|nr:glycosyltransferase family 4 protein [Candidatus Eremiobacteraeota bacterium]